ncbi:UDP-galactopyranose mutase [Lacipirellula sp.]|uniref:UDP-galactopyranose mutase n=1 Tax=Lacipirellula sp. TaxID=2691419 RepID=UPI003D0CB4D2
MAAPKYDFVVVGAGLYGSTFAWCAREAGATCLVVDRRNHIGGNCYTRDSDGITIHQYGPHIFHTNNERVWRFINLFSTFSPYRHRAMSLAKGRLYSLPFTLQTLYEIYGEVEPESLKARLDDDRIELHRQPHNLEEYALATLGKSVYEKLVRGFTWKQWGRHPRELPASILARLPVRETFSTDYFTDRFQGVPCGGYTPLIMRMLDGIEVQLSVDFIKEKSRFTSLAKTVLYTGALDALFENCHGRLDWRYVNLEHERIPRKNVQGAAVLNFADVDIPWTRRTEHKHFLSDASEVTWVTRESTASEGSEPAYPIETDANRQLHSKYRKMALEKGYLIGGRLASYRYFDMHQVISAALSASQKHFRSVSSA